MSKKLFAVLTLLVVFSMLLVACGGNQAPANENVEEPAAEEPAAEEPAAEEPAAEEPVAEEPVEEEPVRTTRVGGWVDTIAISVVTADSAVTQIEAGAIDIYGSGLSTPEDYAAIEAAGLKGTLSYGINYEMTFNPVGPIFEGTEKLNPFSSAKIREAMNWLIDRDYINQEVYGGQAITRLYPFTSGFPEYARNIETIRAGEAYYAYNPEKANEIITSEMEAFGAEMVDGKWTYEGEPVEIIYLIRTDSDGTRVPQGNIISNWLEDIGFTVTRQYGTSSELSPLWILGNPEDGLWHLYTGAWGISGIPRTSADNIQDFFSPNGGLSFSPLWQSYQNSERFEELAQRLANSDYTTPEERAELMAEAIPMIWDNTWRTWIADGVSTTARVPNLDVSYDLGAGVDSSELTPFTLRWDGEEGGLVRWGAPDLFVDPENPLFGSNWTFDWTYKNFISDHGTMSNPHTGVILPQRIERAEVVIQTGLPVSQTYDWVDLSFEDEIVVPDDAWVDWDVENEVFITAAEKFENPQTAKRKSVEYYPSELWDTTWHDGSNVSVADFIMPMIMEFETGLEGSDLYDEAAAGVHESFMASFKGFRITSVDPLVIEWYSDLWVPDAENNVQDMYPARGAYTRGTGAWHNITVSNLAETAGELAYSPDKADALEVEMTNYLGGPTLEIMGKYLDQAIADNYIPYESVLGEYVTADEAAARYANLKSFVDEHNHYLIGTGPYILDEVFLVEKTATLVHNPNFPDLADKWSFFSEPKIADVALDGAGRVPAGSEASFDVFVTFADEPYPADEIQNVKYLLYASDGSLVESGAAELVSDGQYVVTLSAETTGAFQPGAYKVEVVVVAIPVSIPAFATFEFVSE